MHCLCGQALSCPVLWLLPQRQGKQQRMWGFSQDFGRCLRQWWGVGQNPGPTWIPPSGYSSRQCWLLMDHSNMDIPLSLLPSSRSPGGPERILWVRDMFFLTPSNAFWNSGFWNGKVRMVPPMPGAGEHPCRLYTRGWIHRGKFLRKLTINYSFLTNICLPKTPFIKAATESRIEPVIINPKLIHICLPWTKLLAIW